MATEHNPRSEALSDYEIGTVVFDQVTKAYNRNAKLSWRAAWPGDRGPGQGDDFLALDTVDLTVPKGQALGIIGSNGAGKSTLLKLVAGVTTPTSGTIQAPGRLGSMIELGLGFHPELTGTENALCGAAMLGMSREEATDRLEATARFAGIEDAMGTPLKRYSSGMRARLGFAVATQTNVDILAIDEVLAVGDREFQSKCLARISELVASGTTLLFVSHEMWLVDQVCDRVVRIEHGSIIDDGPSSEVIERMLSPIVRVPTRGLAQPADVQAVVIEKPVIDTWSPLVIDVDLDVREPLDGIDIETTFTIPTVNPDVSGGRNRAPLPTEVANTPGRHHLRGTSSPIPLGGGHLRATVGLTDHLNRSLSDGFDDFEMAGATGLSRPMVSVTIGWSLSPQEHEAFQRADVFRPLAPGEKPVIRVVDVVKRYRPGRRRVDVRRAIPGRWGEEPNGPIVALDHVNLDVFAGEALGIIGPNGAGKSTLLKAIAGVISTGSGHVQTTGRVVSMLELGMGFHPDMTGEENLGLSAELLGLTEAQLAERRDSIVEFAGIADAMDVPVKRYSTGMAARLGFALAVHADADIILLDELLAVGDVDFRREALDRIRAINEAGTTVLFVAHNLWMIGQVCRRVIRLEQGQVIDSGPAEEVIERYGGAGWGGDTAENTAPIRLHRLRLSRTRLTPGMPIEFSGWVELDEPCPTVRIECSYRGPVPNREFVTREELEAATFMSQVVQPSGTLNEPGWYRFEGSIDPNAALSGQYDLVVAAVDEREAVALAEVWQPLTVGKVIGATPQVVFDMAWERVDQPVGTVAARRAAPDRDN